MLGWLKRRREAKAVKPIIRPAPASWRGVRPDLSFLETISYFDAAPEFRTSRFGLHQAGGSTPFVGVQAGDFVKEARA